MAEKETKVDLGRKGSFGIHKGALHRALGVPEGERIPERKMEQARHSRNPHERNMARSAAGLKAMAKGGRRKSSRSSSR